MNTRLEGKRVLLVAPKFFGYEIDIKRELERRGAEVDFLPDRPFSSNVIKAVARIYRPLVSFFSERQMERVIRAKCNSPYDLVLVIVGEGLTQKNVKTLRSLSPQATHILYMWDSFANKRYVRKNISLFDVVSTFDPVDAERYRVKFRPLFYVSHFKPSSSVVKYHVSFVGTAHSDRYRVVSDLKSVLPLNLTGFFYLYLQANWVYLLRRALDRNFFKSRRSDFRFESITKSEVQEIFSQSLAVLDIEHPKQNGLTMRTFEALGARKKLITTNVQVRNYDFYDPDNILIFERGQAPAIPPSFFVTPYKQLPDSLVYKYSLAGWLDELINN